MNKSILPRSIFAAAALLAFLISPLVAFAQGGGGRGGIPNVTTNQTAALNAMDQALTNQTAAVTAARTAVATATFVEPKNDADLRTKLGQLSAAELALANARVEQFNKLQAGADKLNAEQVATLIALGGRAGAAGGRGGGRGGGGGNLDPGMVFTRPTESPGLGKTMELPKPDAEGFISMFNGKDLTGWDALPNFWSVKDGSLDCTETLDPGGNIQSDLIWLDSKEHPEKYANFELHVKVRFVSHSGNSGIQFRSRMNRADTKHVGGYQADMDPANQYTGGLHDEDTINGIHLSGGPRPHMGPRGFKTTYPADGSAAKLEPLPENSQTLVALIKPVGEFNDIVIVADGPRITIKVNGHLSSDVIDEYPSSLKSGIIAFQQHAGFQLEVQFKDPKIKLLPAKP